MAHRKLQQEIDRVFKKINEGLEIFNVFHERHESAINTSQKDKLENDLKREIKKLQKLREQIKVWQTSNDVKDKEKLLDYRRLVEVAMEKYKVIEKGSKVKAYSNTSLKQAAELDPEEQEKVDTIEFIQESIDELERQFQSVEVEIEKLSSKKSKKNAAANDAKKEELKDLQSKYRWHEQNLELALRLLENDELLVSDIQEVKEDLEYFLTNNRDENFIENEYIYESLDLDSNEMIQHELVTSFNGITDTKESSPPPEQPPQTTPSKPAQIQPLPPAKEQPSAPSPVPTPKKEPVIPTVPVAAATTPKPTKKFTVLNTTSSSTTPTPITSQPGTPITIGSTSTLPNTLKPAIQPAKPVVEMKWSSLAASGLSNGHTDVVKQSPIVNHAVISTPPVSNTVLSSGSIPKEEPKNLVQSGSSIEAPAAQLQSLQISSSDANANSGLGSTVDLKKEESPVAYSTIDDSNYLNDEELITLPPGIQDIILSVYANRVSTNERRSNNKISNISDYLTIPRYYLLSGFIPQQSSNGSEKNVNQRGLTNEFQRCFNDWNRARILFSLQTPEVFQKILTDLDIGTLFYGYYFSLSPMENKSIELELIRRNWKSDKLKQNWFQKLNNQPIIISDNGFEISNFNKFDSINWVLGELNNFKLDYNLLNW